MIPKKLVLPVFLALETVIFAFLFLFGARGIHMVVHLGHENSIIKSQINDLQAEIQALDTEIQQAKTPFFKEKFARESLQMAQANDTVYYR